jgi:SAM-dependent methyltransferase
MLGPFLPLVDESFDITRCTQEFDSNSDFRLSFDNLPFDTDQFDFTVITEPILDFKRYIEEWERVTKPGSKFAVNLHPALQTDWFVKEYSGQAAVLNGTFLELIKEGTCQLSLSATPGL